MVESKNRLGVQWCTDWIVGMVAWLNCWIVLPSNGGMVESLNFRMVIWWENSEAFVLYVCTFHIRRLEVYNLTGSSETRRKCSRKQEHIWVKQCQCSSSIECCYCVALRSLLVDVVTSNESCSYKISKWYERMLLVMRLWDSGWVLFNITVLQLHVFPKMQLQVVPPCTLTKKWGHVPPRVP